MPSLNIAISPIDIEVRKKLDFRAGDTIRVFQKVKEGEKTRLQAFEGMVLSRNHGKEPGATFTVRKISAGGITASSAFSPKAPWPMSRRAGPRIGFISPTE